MQMVIKSKPRSKLWLIFLPPNTFPTFNEHTAVGGGGDGGGVNSVESDDSNLRR